MRWRRSLETRATRSNAMQMLVNLTLLGIALVAATSGPAAEKRVSRSPDSAPVGTAQDDDTVEVNIETLTGIDYRPGRDLPQEVLDLDGKRIKISGYMGIGTLEGVEVFELLPEACECGRSKVQHFIEVTITDGLTRYRPELMELEGVLRVGEVEEDGFVVSLYRLEIETFE